ncbi:putative quinol monooxygenase [uncultured Microscilla sp.]|uniref:putative quinol monooxygenase n=1 Tax=uncultured Microscilla sp. TaxID=432653 RepID=UPI00262F5A3A|nr:putative quinol monooxygenase [uncultured Microscilla sp.]
METQVFTVASLEAKEGKFEELKQIVADLGKGTREEKGNIEYLIIEDPTKPNTLFSIEKWESKEEEAKHWETTHLKNALSKLETLLAKDVAIYLNKGVQVF